MTKGSSSEHKEEKEFKNQYLSSWNSKGESDEFYLPLRGTRNAYFDTVLANQDTATRFIEKIEYGMRFDWDKFMNIS